MTISQANFVEWPCTFRNKLTDRHTVRTHTFHGPTCLLLILIKTSHECARWCCTFPILGSPIPWFSSVNRLRNGIFFPVLLIQKSHISREREIYQIPLLEYSKIVSFLKRFILRQAFRKCLHFCELIFKILIWLLLLALAMAMAK